MANRKDDVLVEAGAILAAWGGGAIAVLFLDGFPSYVLAGLAICVGIYLMLAVWFDWRRPGLAPDNSPPPIASAPPPPVPPRIGMKLRPGSTTKLGAARIRDQGVAIDLEGELTVKSLDIE